MAIRWDKFTVKAQEAAQRANDLASEHGALRVALAVSPAPLTGDARFDAFIAALVEHHLRAEKLPVPPWTAEPGRRLEDRWIVDEFATDEVETLTPESFRRHAAWCGAWSKNRRFPAQDDILPSISMGRSVIVLLSGVTETVPSGK